MEHGSCLVANRYATELYQVPCHQDLSEDDIRDILEAFGSRLPECQEKISL